MILCLASAVFGCSSTDGNASFTPTGGTSAVAGSGSGTATSGAGGSAPVSVGGAGGASTAGGAPGVGGAAVIEAGGMVGSGGSAPVYIGPGFGPTTVTKADARAAYDAWKTAHLEDCSGGVFRVRWENAKQDATVSEGIGYGMLLTVGFGDRAAFDGLLAYAKKMRDANGLMNWLRYGCDAHRDTKYSGSPDNAASDADLDVAMSLLMAKCKWGDSKYGDDATAFINAIRKTMFADVNGLHVLLPGDSSAFHDAGGACVNYSYFAPGYYRAFAKQVPADAAYWNKAADDTYELLSKGTDSNTGLVRNWGSVNSGGSASCPGSYKLPDSFGSDAARTPWRIATDYLWNTTPKAKAWNDKLTQWVKSQDLKTVLKWYHLDGTLDTAAGDTNVHSAITMGPFAVGAMAFDQTTVNDFAAELVAIPVKDGTAEADYFPRVLKALSLLALTGQFTQCGGP